MKKDLALGLVTCFAMSVFSPVICDLDKDIACRDIDLNNVNSPENVMPSLRFSGIEMLKISTFTTASGTASGVSQSMVRLEEIPLLS